MIVEITKLPVSHKNCDDPQKEQGDCGIKRSLFNSNRIAEKIQYQYARTE